MDAPSQPDPSVPGSPDGRGSRMLGRISYERWAIGLLTDPARGEQRRTLRRRRYRHVVSLVAALVHLRPSEVVLGASVLLRSTGGRRIARIALELVPGGRRQEAGAAVLVRLGALDRIVRAADGDTVAGIALH